ncbi:MAG TPA: adenosylcobinamide-GDP ribazoletransferase [Methanoculleus sp.]|nr:adenosylcobinamide-GDP ribazoletransferase [Methanoculleus sp.]
MVLSAVKALLQFTTVLPLGRHAGYDAFARASWILPIAGYVTGGAGALVALIMPTPVLAAAGALATILVVSGLNHFDGLLDLGDGLMAHGGREKRVNALTDRQIGAGGVGAGIIVTMLAFAGLLSVTAVACAVIIGEVLAKWVQSALIAHGRPFREGMFSYISGFSRPWFSAAAFLLCLPLLLLPVAPAALAGAGAAAVVTFLGVMMVARHLFGGINGDITGAANEVARALVVIALALAGV